MKSDKADTAENPRQVRRLTRDDPGVATVNLRCSRILVMWANHDTLVPVESGWYLHAASAAGRTSVVEGESRPFDLDDPKVRWQHARIDKFGGSDLVLEKGRRYVFFVTADPTRPEDLRQTHLPWPFRLRSPKARSEPAVLVFQAWPLQIDDHQEHEDVSPEGKPRDPWVVAFDSWEHESTVKGRTKNRTCVQDMIDMWAFRGLLGGGAMVHTRGSFDDWKFWCPGEAAYATPQDPYGIAQSPEAGDMLFGSWHYVIPPKQVDSVSKLESPWTAGELREAIRAGRAVALTPGQIVMLGGDCYESPAEMHTDSDRWKNPKNIMKLYWEARQWLEGRRKAWAANHEAYLFEDYKHRYGVVYLVFGLLVSSPDDVQKPATVDEMELVAKGKVLEEGGDKFEISPDHPPSHGRAMASLIRAFQGLAKRARKVDALVDFLRQASGPSRFTEIHFLANTIATARDEKGVTLRTMKATIPWLANVHPQQDLAAAGFTEDDIHRFKTDGVDAQLLQLASTNGRYGDLALQNFPHFSEAEGSSKAFEKYHRKALEMVSDRFRKPGLIHPIPAEAAFHTAFACHFVTDAFSASHMRVPRSKLGPFTSKLMHDIDGLVGLWVYDVEDPDNPDMWYAFGDNNLHAKSLMPHQKELAAKMGADPHLNFEHAARTVGAAFKQLHYQAHSCRQSEPNPPLSTGDTLSNILDANGPAAGLGTSFYQVERRSLADILLNDPPPADLTTARHLRNETLSPGRAGPSRKRFWDHMRMNIHERVDYVKSLVPRPLPEAPRTTKSLPKRVPDSTTELVNIPQLFSEDGKLISNDKHVYDIVTGSSMAVQGWTHYAGFTLRVYWGPFKDTTLDRHEMRLNFDKFYFMNKFFKDVVGLKDLMDKRLIDVYRQLHREIA